MILNYYFTLGLQPYTSKNEIKRAFRVKAKILHPDISKHPNAQIEFLKIRNAYETLMKYSTEDLIQLQAIQEQQKVFFNKTKKAYHTPKKKKKTNPNYEKFTAMQDARIQYIKTLAISMLSLSILGIPLTFFIEEKKLNTPIFITCFIIIIICAIIYTIGVKSKYNPNKNY